MTRVLYGAAKSRPFPGVAAAATRRSTTIVWFAHATLAASLAITSGCASFLDPYPESEALQRYRYSSATLVPDETQTVATNSTTFAGGLAAAIDVANAQRLTYIKAARQQTVTRQVGAVALTGMSAAALFLGITSDGRASRDFITGAGITGASVLALDSFVLSRPRQALHLRAAAAIDCAVLTMRPWLIPATTFESFTNESTTAKTALSALDDSIDKAQTKLTLLLAVYAAHPRAVPGAETIDKARADRARVDGVIRSAITFRASVETADATLIGNVRQIVSTVNVEAQKTEPELSTLQASLAGLPKLAQAIIPGGNYTLKSVVDAAKAPGVENLESGGGDDRKKHEKLLELSADEMAALEYALDDLRTKAASAVADADKLRPVLENYEALRTQLAGDISSCRPTGVTTRFAVAPDLSELTVMPGSAYDFAVHVDTGMPRSALVGSPMADTTVAIVLVNGTYVARLAIGATAEGETTLLLGDGTDPARKSVLIKVHKTVSEVPVNPLVEGDPVVDPSPDPSVAIDSAEFPNLSDMKAMTLQARLNQWMSGEAELPAASLCVDGKVGAKTKTVAALYRKHFAIDSGTSTWTQVQTVLTEQASSAEDFAAAEGKPVTEAEKAMSADEITAMQSKLVRADGSAPASTGKFDQATREGLKQLQSSSNLPVTGTILDSNIARRIADPVAEPVCADAP